MKIECENDKIIVYLYNDILPFDDINLLNKKIKEIFIKIIKIYHLNFFGYSIVNIYHNDYYGCILEIEKIYNSDFNTDIMDLKVIIHKNVDFFLEIDDDLYVDSSDFTINNDKYYINLSKINNIYKYIEYGKIVYKNV